MFKVPGTVTLFERLSDSATMCETQRFHWLYQHIHRANINYLMNDTVGFTEENGVGFQLFHD